MMPERIVARVDCGQCNGTGWNVRLHREVTADWPTDEPELVVPIDSERFVWLMAQAEDHHSAAGAAWMRRFYQVVNRHFREHLEPFQRISFARVLLHHLAHAARGRLFTETPCRRCAGTGYERLYVQTYEERYVEAEAWLP